MHFYRALGKISALTFDLDDTLYDNRPVILRTTQAVLSFVQDYHPNLRDLSSADYEVFRQQLVQQNPDVVHDVSEWRRQALVLAMLDAGLSATDAREGADAAMVHFDHWRSQITISQENHETLTQLAAKWPLVAITNGNAKPERFGLGQYFSFVLRAGPDGRSKPFSDMYQLAATRLNIPLGEILHVGDDLTTDVAGSIRSGMQACWINLRQDDLMTAPDSRLLPHLEISRLASLRALI